MARRRKKSQWERKLDAVDKIARALRSLQWTRDQKQALRAAIALVGLIDASITL